MPKVDKKTKKIVVVVSFLVAVCIGVVGYSMVCFSTGLDDFVFFSFLAIVSPLAMLNYVDYRWRKGVDEHLPDLFRSMVQAQETGMTLPKALEEAAKRDYGPLTSELKKITAQISWGSTFG